MFASCLAFVFSNAIANEPVGLQLIHKIAILDPGEIVVFWTAPGDDGYSGRASGYDLRYQPYSAGPINTDQEWLASTHVTNEPIPSQSGQIDSVVVDGLEYGASYYFCIKAYDNVLNYSGMSNSPFLTAGDTTGYDYLVGDLNNNGYVNGLDVLYLVAYLKGQNPPPEHLLSGDTNGDCAVNGIDVIYLVMYFKGGPELIRGDCRTLQIDRK
jgi:hypothetical protein